MLRVDSAAERCASALIRKIERSEDRLNGIKNKEIFKSPEAVFSDVENALSDMYERVLNSFSYALDEKMHKLSLVCGKLDALSPLATLARGYSVVTVGENTLTKIADAEVGKDIIVRVTDGTIAATVTGKDKSNG
jgi:exodeoxyribonuclease VII large subunit